MDERRRFQIALGGVASCVLIAAMFISSAPPLTFPAVPSPRSAFALPVSQGAVPVVEGDEQRRRPHTRVVRPPRATRVVETRSAVRLVAEEPVGLQPPPSQASLPSRPPGLVFALAPVTHTAHVAIATDPPQPSVDPEHGPVTGAFVTAGKEVGRGFRTAGRAIKAIF